MKRTVWTFGLIAGGILSAMMLLTIPFMDRIGYDRGEVIGYTTMVLAFLLVFFGIRSYRDNAAGGSIGFGRAFTVGALIVLIASACYVAAWEVIRFKLAPDFVERFQAHRAEQIRASGDSPEEIQKQLAEMEKYAEMYRNPAIHAAITFIEPLPVGLVIALVSAGILSRGAAPAGGAGGGSWATSAAANLPR
ncbi:MAG TPA: DUF4199 domain-containing protein [Longimicrobium sp.]|nr:DUF4199 domain-containing protein [Longimicrobium sp.]